MQIKDEAWYFKTTLTAHRQWLAIQVMLLEYVLHMCQKNAQQWSHEGTTQKPFYWNDVQGSKHPIVVWVINFHPINYNVIYMLFGSFWWCKVLAWCICSSLWKRKQFFSCNTQAVLGVPLAAWPPPHNFLVTYPRYLIGDSNRAAPGNRCRLLLHISSGVSNEIHLVPL